MIGCYLVRGLALVNQMGNQFIFFCELGFGHVNPSPGTFKEFQVLAVSKTRIIEVLVNNGTFVNRLVAPVTDIGSFVQAAAAFLNEVFAGLITGGAGSAFHITEDDLGADIGFPAMVALCAL